MPLFKYYRDRVFSTTSGHIIAFKKDEETWVPPDAVSYVMSAGAVPVDESFVPPEDENTTTADNGEQLSPDERRAKITEAYDFMISRNDRDDFTAGGKPHPRAVSKIVGFTVESKENNLVWQSFVEEKADE